MVYQLKRPIDTASTTPDTVQSFLAIADTKLTESSDTGLLDTDKVKKTTGDDGVSRLSLVFPAGVTTFRTR